LLSFSFSPSTSLFFFKEAKKTTTMNKPNKIPHFFKKIKNSEQKTFFFLINVFFVNSLCQYYLN